MRQISVCFLHLYVPGRKSWGENSQFRLRTWSLMLISYALSDLAVPHWGGLCYSGAGCATSGQALWLHRASQEGPSGSILQCLSPYECLLGSRIFLCSGWMFGITCTLPPLPKCSFSYVTEPPIKADFLNPSRVLSEI